MSNMTPQEQLMLELINRARMNPNGEAARYGIALNEGLAAGTISSTPKQVLAGNNQLNLSSDKHSTWMLHANVFAHDETTGGSGAAYYYATHFNERILKAGYSYSSAGENIAWRGTTGTLNATSTIVTQMQDLFVDAGYPGRGHRLNILGDFKEMGVGQALGVFNYNGTNYNSSLVTEDFGKKGTATFVTGVVYNDTVINDNFFTVGEQTAGRVVSGTGATSNTTGAGGGYELSFAATGAKTISFALAGGTVSVALTLAATNIKVDVVNGHEVWTNGSVRAVTTNITEMHALGISAMNLTGSSANDKLFGNNGTNGLNGSTGNDSLYGGAGKDVLTGGTGADHFAFNTTPSTSNFDSIADFAHASDHIDLENAIFTALTATGTLSSAAFLAVTSGHAAANASQHIIYNKTDGSLWYDRDGSSATYAPVEFAVLTTHPSTVSNIDFTII